MHKLADGLLSGRYSHPRPAPPSTTSQAAELSAPKEVNPLAHDSPTPVFQDGVRPSGFKSLVGKGHAEFATMRQQDAEEFLSYLLTALRRYSHAQSTPKSSEPTEIFSFGIESRLACRECGGVRYRVDGADVLGVGVPAREKGREQDKLIYEEVRVEECIDTALGVEELDYNCPRCQKSVTATK
jgi:ubiquitin carboxyl-terminal hydrolase 5/13